MYGQFKATQGAPGVPPNWTGQAGPIVNPAGVGSAVAMGNGTVVRSYPTLAAAGPALAQGCPFPATDMTTMVPKTIVQQHVQTVTWFTKAVEQHPVTTATSVQVIQHPTICGQMPTADVCAPAVAASPCGVGACGVGGAAVGGFLPSTILPGGSVSQTAFRY